mgnify:CR=1 FL=1
MGCKEFNFAGLGCLEQAQNLYNAYISMLTGQQRVRIQYGNDYVEYAAKSTQDMDALRHLYMTIWKDCPEAQNVLPAINNHSARRGPALFGQLGRGRYR